MAEVGLRYGRNGQINMHNEPRFLSEKFYEYWIVHSKSAEVGNAKMKGTGKGLAQYV